MTTLRTPVDCLALHPYTKYQSNVIATSALVQVRNMYRQPSTRARPAFSKKFHPLKDDPRVLAIYGNEKLSIKERQKALKDVRQAYNQDRARYLLEKEQRIAKAKMARLARLREFGRLFSPTPHYVDSGVAPLDTMMFVPGKRSLVVQSIPDGPWTSRVCDVTYVYPRFDVYHTGIHSPGPRYSTNYISGRFVQNRLLQQVKMSPVNLAMMLAEYRQTASMFQDAAVRLLQFSRDLKKGRIPVMKRFKRYTADKGYIDDWLIYRYGVTPLLGDLVGIDAWLSGEYTVPIIKRFSIYEGKMRSESLRAPSTFPSLGAPFRAKDIFVTKSKQVAWVEYNSSYFKTFNQVGLTNPLLLGWEVIPYSFVVDWFIQIGSYLETIDALQGVKRIAITRSQKATSELYLGDVRAGGGNRYTRAVITPSAINNLTYGPSLTAKRCVDAVALVGQLFRKR